MPLCSICSDITFYPKQVAKPRRESVLENNFQYVEASKVDEHTEFVAFLHSSFEELEIRVSERRAVGNVCPFCEILLRAFRTLEASWNEAHENGEECASWSTGTPEMSESKDLWLLWRANRKPRGADGLLAMSSEEIRIGRAGFDLAPGLFILDEAAQDEIRNRPSWNHQVAEYNELRRETRLSDNSTGSLRALELAKSWIDTCKSTHLNCGHLDTLDRQLPTRLLDVSRGAVRLVESINLPIQIPYATLSHRWGDIHPMTTITANYTNHTNGFALEDLPKTFHDAITIIRFIGYQHIWIDSLCIIQDSNDDKQKEIPKMADYYGGAELNIFAAKAQNCLEGCFQSRNGLSIRPLWIPLKVVGRDVDVSVKTTSFIQLYYDQKDLVSALDSRGWILQERVFAPRTVYYGSFLRYTCPEMAASEASPEGRLPNRRHNKNAIGFHSGNDLDLDKFGAMTRAMQAGLVSPSRASQLKELLQLWYRLAETYSKRELSFENDRPLAISSCASKVGLLSGDEYLAGLWKSDLIRGLNWIVEGKGGDDDPQKYKEGPPKYEKVRPPTWSWLSLGYGSNPYRVTWMFSDGYGRDSHWPSGLEEKHHGEIVFCIDRCIVVATDERNKFGPVTVAELHVQGFLVNGLAIQLEEDSDDEYILVHPTKGPGRLIVDWDGLPSEDNLATQVSIIPILFGESEHSVIDPEEISGLVVIGTGGSTYERIGHATHIPASWLQGHTKQCLTLV